MLGTQVAATIFFLLELGVNPQPVTSVELSQMTVAERYTMLLESRKRTRQDETLTGKAEARIIGQLYDRLFVDSFNDLRFKRVTDENLPYLFDAASHAEFYTHMFSYTEHMAAVFAELQRRSLTTETQHKRMYGAYLATREFSRAAEFLSRYPSSELESLPEYVALDAIHDGQPSELRIDPARQALIRSEIHLDDTFRVVVISHALCHFSQRAVESIAADPVLRPLFIKYSKWLAPQDRALHFEQFVQHNRKYPEFPISLVYKESEWPMIDDWGTPIFYFLRGDEVFAKIIGWPLEGSKTELMAAFDRAGVSLQQANH